MPDRAQPSFRSGKSQIQSLTALRGLAAWWVVLFHFSPYLLPHVPAWTVAFIAKGYLAVDLFFCLSGFVIFLNYGHLKLGDAREIAVFYAKRLAKIYPLHILVLCLYLLLVGLLLLTHHGIPEQRFSLISLVENLLLIQDWTVTRDMSWNVPSWSISAELAAYLLFPLLVRLVRLAAGRIAASLCGIALVMCLLNVFYALVDFQIGEGILLLGVVRCVTQFTIGALLAQLYEMNTVRGRYAGLCFLVFAGLFLFVGSGRLESVLMPLGWAALVMAVALGAAGLAFLNHRWLVFVGEISYATYMIHYFIRDVFKLAVVRSAEMTSLLDVLLAFVFIFALSIPLYLFVERPAQRYLTPKALLKTVASRARSQVA